MYSQWIQVSCRSITVPVTQCLEKKEKQIPGAFVFLQQDFSSGGFKGVRWLVTYFLRTYLHESIK